MLVLHTLHMQPETLQTVLPVCLGVSLLKTVQQQIKVAYRILLYDSQIILRCTVTSC